MALIQRIQRPLDSGEAGTAPQGAPQTFPAAALDAPRDHDTAYDLLDRAVSAFDALTRRAQQLEAELGESQGKLAAEAVRMDEMTANWARLSEGMRAHAHEGEQRLAQAVSRAEAAEAKVAEAIIRAEASELRCAELQNRSTRLHDKVVASFGIGSRAQLMLESMAATDRTAPAIAVH